MVRRAILRRRQIHDFIGKLRSSYVQPFLHKKKQSGGIRVSVQGVKSLGGHFACLCRGFDFYEVKQKLFFFQKEKGNNFTPLIIFIVKSLQKEQNDTNLLL